MRIGIDARMYRSSVAGIGRYCQNLIKNLLEIDRENGYILFMTSEDKKEFENYLIKNSLKIENSKLKIIEADIPHFSLAEQTKFPKIIEQENLDLMHFLNFNYPVRYHGKFISVIHDLTLIKYPNTARDTNIFKQIAFKYVIGKACRNASKIIAVSENTKKDIIKYFKIPERKIKVIYEAADDKIIKLKTQNSKLKTKYNITKPVILYVGQFRRHKNIEGLIRAFEILRNKIPCQLVLVGRVEIDPSLKELLDKSEFKRDILMPGFVRDQELAAWYKIACVFVFPSFYEGFGLPGLEAIQAGLPVIASYRASLPEIYREAALYFNPLDSTDIAVKIKEVMTNKKLKEDLIAKGRKVSCQYSWQKTAEETLDLYKEIKSKIKNQKSK